MQEIVYPQGMQHAMQEHPHDCVWHVQLVLIKLDVITLRCLPAAERGLSQGALRAEAPEVQPGQELLQEDVRPLPRAVRA